MSRRTEKRIETIEHGLQIIACDICGEEVPVIERPIYGGDFQTLSDELSPRQWWRKPLGRIVGIVKGSASDELSYSPDFEVHVRCAYELIKRRLKMTPSEIKQLTPDGYGGDFEMTMEVGE